jgi:GT2 family glycosyltransferase
MHITIISVCHSRQGNLERVIPLWLAQEGIDFDIVVAVGPDMPRTPYPKVTYIDAGPWGNFMDDNPPGGLSTSYNLAYKAAKGDYLFVTFSDMMMPDPRYIAKLAKYAGPNKIVTRQLIRADGGLDEGLWMHGMLVDKALLDKSGGWDPFYNCNWAWEDTDFSHGLVAAGVLPKTRIGLIVTSEINGTITRNIPGRA